MMADVTIQTGPMTVLLLCRGRITLYEDSAFTLLEVEVRIRSVGVGIR